MFPLLKTYNSINGTEKIPFTIPFAMITCLTTRLNHYYDFKGKRLPIQMSLIRQFAISNELLYSGFVLPNVHILFVQNISFATFGVSTDDFFARYTGRGYSLFVFYASMRKCARDFYVILLLRNIIF